MDGGPVGCDVAQPCKGCICAGAAYIEIWSMYQSVELVCVQVSHACIQNSLQVGHLSAPTLPSKTWRSERMFLQSSWARSPDSPAV